MIGFEQHNKNKEIPTIKIIPCPACNKKRLGKYTNADGTVEPASDETVEVRGKERHLEVCQFCSNRYRKEEERFVLENMRKMAKAFKESEDKDAATDHKDFSLN